METCVGVNLTREDIAMKLRTTIAAGLLAALCITSSVWADSWDKKTYMTVNETILIPGKALAPGKYVMKLANVTANRHVVQIFNEDQTELQATILAFNNYRLQPTEETELQYWETPAGSPPALRAWFFPGDNYGQEFAYPKETAERLARENNAKVPSYETAGILTEEDAVEVAVNDAPEEIAPPPETLAQRPVAPAPSTPVPVPAAKPSQPENVIAQNTPPPPPAAPNQQAAPRDEIAPDGALDELPRTASTIPFVLLCGLVLLAGALSLRKLRA
jgi:hypothetical protein